MSLSLFSFFLPRFATLLLLLAFSYHTVLPPPPLSPSVLSLCLLLPFFSSFADLFPTLALFSMEQLAHIATIVASMAAVAAPPAVVAGLVPRVGPGRAFVLGLSSRIFLRAKTVSQRTVEVEKMRTALSNANRD